MKIIVCVEILNGVVDCMKAFENMEAALRYFDSIVPNDGSWYEVYRGDDGAYAVDSPDDDYEIHISEVEMEG